MSKCPKGHADLEPVSGQYDTGVVAPDGGRESYWESGYYCELCNRVYGADDLEDEGE